MSCASENRAAVEVVQGTDLQFTLTVANPDGSAMTLGGYTVSMWIRRTVQDEADTLLLTGGSGLEIDTETGVISGRVTAVQTAALSGRYVFRILLTEPGGVVIPGPGGSINVSPG